MTPATLTPPPVQPFAPGTPAAAGPRPYRWTIRAYRKLGETGLLDCLRTVLIRGEILVVPNPNPPHDEALNLAQEFLRAAFATGHHVRNQQGFDVATEDDPGPDLAVVTGSIRDLHGRTPTAAVMIVEVADSSLSGDTTTKAELYATAGVPEYWVIDVAGRQLHVFRGPVPLPAGLGATAYRTHLTLGDTDTLAPLAAPHASVTVADLLP